MAASVAGCSSVFGGGGGDGGDDSGDGNATGSEGRPETSTPRAVVEAYTTAGANGNTELMRSLVHPESPLEPSSSGDGSASMERIETINTSNGLATVVAEGTFTQDGESQTIRLEFDVRRYQGEWLIYTFGQAD